MEILNNSALDNWLQERIRKGRDIKAIKGEPPKGATYDDGTPITRPINVAWQDMTTGEIFGIEYAV